MPKRFRVAVAQRAESDVAAIHDFIARDKPRAARKWVRELRKPHASLRQFPQRFEVIPEQEYGDFEFEYRHVLFGNYRTIDRIDGDTVQIVRVIQAAHLFRPG